jgi:hypothetical protein
MGTMKEYKLSGWPDLAGPYQKTCFRRMVSDMSHRFVTFAQLLASSGAPRADVRAFLAMLSERGMLLEREAEPDTLLDSIGSWLRRTMIGDARTS